jgi:hypothetical protein
MGAAGTLFRRTEAIMEKVTYFWATLRDGKETRVAKVEKYTEVTNADSVAQEFIPTIVSYRTDEGYHLTPMESGAFKVVETGEVVRLRS